MPRTFDRSHISETFLICYNRHYENNKDDLSLSDQKICFASSVDRYQAKVII